MTSYIVGGSSAPKTDEVVGVMPEAADISPLSELLQCESEDNRVYDNPLPLREETQTSIPLVENVCYATTLRVSDREVKASKIGEDRSKHVTRPMPSPAWKPALVASVPVALFGEHVKMKHQDNNQPFITEFAVRYHTHSAISISGITPLHLMKTERVETLCKKTRISTSRII